MPGWWCARSTPPARTAPGWRPRCPDSGTGCGRRRSGSATGSAAWWRSGDQRDGSGRRRSADGGHDRGAVGGHRGRRPAPRRRRRRPPGQRHPRPCGCRPSSAAPRPTGRGRRRHRHPGRGRRVDRMVRGGVRRHHRPGRLPAGGRRPGDLRAPRPRSPAARSTRRGGPRRRRRQPSAHRALGIRQRRLARRLDVLAPACWSTTRGEPADRPTTGVRRPGWRSSRRGRSPSPTPGTRRACRAPPATTTRSTALDVPRRHTMEFAFTPWPRGSMWRMPPMPTVHRAPSPPSPSGIARGAIDDLTELAEGKTPYRSNRRLAERDVAQTMVARAEAATRSARAFLVETLEGLAAAAARGDDVTMHERADRPAGRGQRGPGGHGRGRPVLRGGRHHGACSSTTRCSAATATSTPSASTWRWRYTGYETVGRVLFGLEPDTAADLAPPPPQGSGAVRPSQRPSRRRPPPRRRTCRCRPPPRRAGRCRTRPPWPW